MREVLISRREAQPGKKCCSMYHPRKLRHVGEERLDPKVRISPCDLVRLTNDRAELPVSFTMTKKHLLTRRRKPGWPVERDHE